MKRITILFSLFIVLIIVLADRGQLGVLGFLNSIPYADKAGHFILYGILTLLLDLTFIRSLPHRSPKRVVYSVGISLALAFLWWVLNMYTFPFMLVQTEPSYLNALRNSVVLFIKWPGQALGFTLFNLLVIGLSLWSRFPWLVFGASLPALMACLCVKDIVDRVNETNLAKS